MTESKTDDAARGAYRANWARDKDGGPAFPMPGQHHRYGDVETTEATLPGMSLLDYFAGQAVSCLAQHFNDGHFAPRIAAEAYDVADAMLAERSKEKP